MFRSSPMRPTVFSWLSLAFFFLVMSNSWIRAQDADKIYPKSGAPQTGKILEVTRDNIVMEVRGNKQNFPTHDVVRVVYEGEPAQFSKAKEQIATNQLDQALESLKRIDSKSVEREEIKKDLIFYQGYVQAQMALHGQGDLNVAGKRLLTYAQSFPSGGPQSHHFYDVSETLGSLAVARGAYDEAAKYFSAMGQSQSNEIKLRSRYLLGSTLLTQAKIPEARKAFAEAVAGSADTLAAKKYQKMSRVAINRCDTADGKIPEAIESLRKMVADSDATDSQLFANIYNALGEAHKKSGKNEEAVLDFLHTDLLFSSEKEAHAEALYYLMELFVSIGEPQRGADAKSRLQALYATSPWSKK